MISPAPENKNILEIWRATVFNNIIRGVAVAGIVAYVFGVGLAYKNLTLEFFISYTFAFLWVILTAFMTRIPTVYRAYSFTIILFVLGVLTSIERAAIGDGRIWLFLSVVFASIFLGRRASWVFTILAVFVWGMIGYFFNTSLLTVPEINQISFSIWSGTTLTLLIAGAITILTMGALLSNLGKTISESYFLARKSEEQNEELKQQRQSLEKYSSALEASVIISRHLSTLATVQEIFSEAPELLQEGYALNCAAIFVLEEDRLLRLESSIGWKEQAFLTDEYVLSVDEGITGLAVREGKAYSNSTSTERLRTTLAETRSFAAIPLHGRNAITGVIVFQSLELDDFDAKKLTTIQSLADQIAVLLENANLLAEKESALEAERRAYGEITQTAWDAFLKSQNFGGYQRDKDGLSLVAAKAFYPSEKHQEFEQVPIKIRGKVIGYIDAQKPDKRAWTVSEKELLGTLAARLENALDSARLYEETQRRAANERLISQASSRMRERLNIEAVLQAAVQELHNAIGDAAETEVWISPDQNTGDSEGENISDDTSKGA
ncbi:MAG: GAF domain-containing protein [Anaerolineae bacterium]|jgi:GAF domain-containing protein|nr:GAF domain-containing protein [Anaerolineae bacterium]MBT7192252.1 GAF domain-containing protein [Anaerolineae bacterium]MBT7990909.1 GAF domain-containing protein [Anaerolineae bacterium]